MPDGGTAGRITAAPLMLRLGRLATFTAGALERAGTDETTGAEAVPPCKTGCGVAPDVWSAGDTCACAPFGWATVWPIALRTAWVVVATVRLWAGEFPGVTIFTLGRTCRLR